MDEHETEYFRSLSPSEKILFVLKRNGDDFAGPQSTERLEKFLNMKRKNLDSILSRLAQKGRIERISPGVYKYPGDTRPPRI